MTGHNSNELEEFISHLARTAGEVTLQYFQGDFQVETKSDQSPVTIADKKTEETLRNMISKAFPDHGILGEEFGEATGTSAYRWILDPIDGTKPFVAGVPQYTILIALEHDNDTEIAAIYNPPLDRLMIARKGGGCRLNGKAVQMRKIDDISQAWALCSDYAAAVKRSPQRFPALMERCWFAPGWGDAYGYTLLAEGKCDIMVDAHLSLWDAAPLKVIIEESGGIFSDWNGNKSIYVEHGVAASPNIHAQMMEILGDKNNG